MILDNRYALGIFLQCSLTLLWNVVCTKVSVSCQIKYKKTQLSRNAPISTISPEIFAYFHVATPLLGMFQFVYNTTRVSWVSNFGDRRPRRGLRHPLRATQP